MKIRIEDEESHIGSFINVYIDDRFRRCFSYSNGNKFGAYRRAIHYMNTIKNKFFYTKTIKTYELN